MSDDKSGDKDNQSDSSKEPARDQVSEAWRSDFKGFVQECKRNNAEERRRQLGKEWWSQATAVGAWAYTLLILIIAYIGLQQFLLSQNQERAQLRPYVLIHVKSGTPLTEGAPSNVPLGLENVGKTPVYHGGLYPIFQITFDGGLYGAPPVCANIQTSGDPHEVFGKTSSYDPVSKFNLTKQQIDLIRPC